MITKIILKLFSRTALVIICFISRPAFAQLNANNLTQYSERDGLPSSEVRNIISDRFGYIWIGTSNGLTRFDGYEFKRFYYNPNDSSTFAGGDVESLYEDHDGKIWIGSSPTKLNRYDPATATFTQYGFEYLIDHPADVELAIYSICENNNGRIYFAAISYRGEKIRSALLYKDPKDDKLKHFIVPDSLLIENVYRMKKDKAGNIIFFSNNKLFKISSENKLSKMYLPVMSALLKNGEHMADFEFDKNGYLWIISCKSRLYRVNLGNNEYEIFTPPGKYFDEYFNNNIVIDKNADIWMGTNMGLIKYGSQTGKFDYLENESKAQIGKAAANYLKFDAFGALWIGTSNAGLLKYEQRALFKSYTYNKEDKNSITPGWVNMVYETGDGKVWAGSSGVSNLTGGLNELDLQTNTISSLPFNTILPGTWAAYGAFENKPGELQLNTNAGTWLFSPKTKAAKKIMFNGLADSIVINNSYKDSKGNYWLCTQKGLFKKNNDAETFRRYDLSVLPRASTFSNEITKAMESPQHGLWLATNNGLFLYNYSNDKIERHAFDKKEGDILLTQDINSFYEDADGMLWVGTWQGGLSVYNLKTRKIKTYTQNDGLPSMCIQGILPDEKNNTLWLSTFEGISRMDLKAKQFNNFSIADGIQSQLFADGAYLRTTGGFFVFGGSNGITVFNPDNINKQSTPPIVFLTDLKLFNKSVVPGEKSILKNPVYDTKEITLDYNQNNISLEFIALHYSNPSKNKYAYKLENYDNEWRDIGNQHAAYYPNLPQGKYIFHVKASNNNGVWNEKGATLSITVNPPWWKTTGAYIMYVLLIIAAAFIADRYVRHRLVQKERERNQARELAQAKEIEKAYNELKATQALLIQSEKMASLGELTAGIAHEIQNPLNFVNNFSDINKELLVEMKDEMEKGNISDAKAIADNVIDNEEKINYHGKRADAIVKGMLQHSRSSNGNKEPTDINALCDEYLRLSYHGLRAKEKSFNASIKTDFDNSIGTVNIIPQDVGRVLLNLYNNAFYAVNERQKAEGEGLPTGQAGYKALVTVETKKIKDKVEISVTDNGAGIPQNIVDKIFQPFFTTKPTGQGTGLGLSLSYDIVKAHAGEIKVESKLSEGTTFIIRLPVDNHN